jgi:hypothetical protein
MRRKVIDGELKHGDFPPTEATLMGQLDVSRSTLRDEPAMSPRHWRSHRRAFGAILTHHYGKKTVCG